LKYPIWLGRKNFSRFVALDRNPANLPKIKRLSNYALDIIIGAKLTPSSPPIGLLHNHYTIGTGASKRASLNQILSVNKVTAAVTMLVFTEERSKVVGASISTATQPRVLA